MTEPDGSLSKYERKKAARKQRQHTERQAGRDLDAATGEAITEALRLAPLVSDATTVADRDQVIDIDFGSIDAARFVHKRVNEALRVDEWLDVVQVWIWNADRHVRDPLSERGQANGYELRIERAG